MLIYSYVAKGCRNAKHKQTKAETHKTSVGLQSGKFRCSLLGVHTHIQRNHLCVCVCGRAFMCMGGVYNYVLFCDMVIVFQLQIRDQQIMPEAL